MPRNYFALLDITDMYTEHTNQNSTLTLTKNSEISYNCDLQDSHFDRFVSSVFFSNVLTIGFLLEQSTRFYECILTVTIVHFPSKYIY